MVNINDKSLCTWQRLMLARTSSTSFNVVFWFYSYIIIFIYDHWWFSFSDIGDSLVCGTPKADGGSWSRGCGTISWDWLWQHMDLFSQWQHSIALPDPTPPPPHGSIGFWQKRCHQYLDYSLYITHTNGAHLKLEHAAGLYFWDIPHAHTTLYHPHFNCMVKKGTEHWEICTEQCCEMENQTSDFAPINEKFLYAATQRDDNKMAAKRIQKDD